jgi:multidrug efflux pump subunit AcrB
MILVILGSWRSTLIVATSIALSILTSVIVLWALGQSLNTMTLGGLALAVGVLVDDATVELENVHRNFGFNKPIRQAILDGAAQIATPAFVSTLAICIVFVPVLFLSGPAASLFYPLALAVVFAMLASYLLSRTLVPTMVLYMLPKEVPLYTDPEQAATASGPIWRFHRHFDNYVLAVETPPDRVPTVDALMSTPIINGIIASGQLPAATTYLASPIPRTPGPGGPGQQIPRLPTQQQPQLLSNISRLHRTVSEAVVSHYNVQPVFEVYADVQDRDLGAVSADVQRVVG